MRRRMLFWLEAGMVAACICLLLWWPYAIDLFTWHSQPPVRGICWLVSLVYLGILCLAPITVDGTRLSNLL